MTHRPGGNPTSMLVGFGEALAATEVIWSLMCAGHRVVTFLRRGQEHPVSRLRGVEVVRITAPEASAAQAAAELSALLATHRFDAVMPLDDASVWLLDRVAIPVGVTLVGPSETLARFAIDKSLQLAAAQSVGFAIPPTETYSTVEDALVTGTFPCMVKPAWAVTYDGDVVSRPGGRRCADRAELEKLARTARWNCPVLVQPLIRGTGIGVFGLAMPGGEVIAPSAHRRVRMMNPDGSGSSACRAEPIAQSDLAAAEALIADTGWEGLFMVELLEEPSGRRWFMEFNGRAWGSMALARRQGAEYPAWAVSSALGERPDTLGFVPHHGLTCRHLGRECVHLMFAMRGPRSRDAVGWPSRWEAMRSVLRTSTTDRWYNCQPGARRHALLDAAHTIKGALR